MSPAAVVRFSMVGIAARKRPLHGNSTPSGSCAVRIRAPELEERLAEPVEVPSVSGWGQVDVFRRQGRAVSDHGGPTDEDVGDTVAGQRRHDAIEVEGHRGC